MYSFEQLGFGFSEEGLQGRVELLHDFVNVRFYFEDEAKENFYEFLVNLMFPELVTEHVFCLGGKGNVLAEAQKEDNSGVPRIFLLDKDFDDLLTKLSDPEGVIRLRAYSIENYFLDVNSLCKAAAAICDDLRLSNLDANKNSILKNFNRIVVDYAPIAKLFYAVRRFNLSNVKTTKRDYKDFIKNGDVDNIVHKEILANFIHEIQRESLKQSNRLSDINIITQELASDFVPKRGCVAKGDQKLLPNFPGKHLFHFLCEVIDRLFGTKLQNIASGKLMIGMMSQGSTIAGLLVEVKADIEDSISRQRSIAKHEGVIDLAMA